MRLRLSGVVCVLIAMTPAARGLAQDVCANRQTPRQVDARVDALLGRMTLAEKIAQLADRAPAIPRLGLPAYNWWSEGLHGQARDGYATVFPQALGLAATWDKELLHAVGDTVSTEARAKYNQHGPEASPRYGGLTIWSPNINIFRDPRWGRGQETYGEDPVLTAALGTQFVRGMQGSDSFYLKADATPKHFVAHSGPEEGRDSFNAQVTAHDLADTYLPAFHAAITDGHAAALMCSYNAINGTPSCATGENLNALVRGRWGFSGYVVSDCDAVGDIATYHHFAKDVPHAAADALEAGVDLDCGNSYAALSQSVAQGLTSEAAVDRALHRLLLARLRLGMMDRASCTGFGALGAADIDSAAERALALRAAEESIVLLKNDGTLPLQAATQRVAVIGPTADMLKVLEANYHGTASHPVTLLDGLLADFTHVSYAQGSLLAQGVFAPVPRTALRQGAGSGAGLVAEYFDTALFAGVPAVRTEVETVDLDLDRVEPSPAITSRQYAARWSGMLVAPAAGSYTFRVDIERCWDCTTHDSFDLFLDDKNVIHNSGAKGDPDRVTLPLSAAVMHTLRLELKHTGEDEGIVLEWEPPAEALLAEAEHAARDADVIVAAVGLSPDLEGEALQVQLQGFRGGDRTSLDLPQAQRTLLARLQALGKPVVVVLTSGSAVALGPEAKDAVAVLEAWYPGEAGGTALAHLLAGKVNPSGRLPVTFYRSVADLPAFTDYSMAHRTYRYYDGPVQYGFGYGLSYSSFQYGAVRLQSDQVRAGQALTLTVEVRNESDRDGDEVAELYLQPPQLPGAPRLALKGFERLTLRAHETRTVRFVLTPEQMSTVDAAGARAVHAGAYRLFVGGSQPDPVATEGTTLRVTGETTLP